MVENEVRKQIIGMGLIIINAKNGKIWTITELTKDPSHGKNIGDQTIPLETRKEKESSWDNLIGALAEAFSDHDTNGRNVSQYLSEHLFLSQPTDSTNDENYPNIVTTNENNEITCQYGVLIYDGDDIPFKTSHIEEVGNGKWLPLTFIGNSKVRSLARSVVLDLFKKGTFFSALYEFRNNISQRKPAFAAFSIEEAFKKRQLLPDEIKN